ncbi:MAG: SAM-dependent methyltransferase, partial [Salibacteraceae bacterium]|nr:SAM-dependent methyltransferase [Salibacteraceae bacterium]
MEEDKLKPKIIESADGSHTLRVESLNENYHSHKGALTESLHVFLKMGLALFSEKESIQLLEVGFGTGLN